MRRPQSPSGSSTKTQDPGPPSPSSLRPRSLGLPSPSSLRPRSPPLPNTGLRSLGTCQAEHSPKEAEQDGSGDSHCQLVELS